MPTRRNFLLTSAAVGLGLSRLRGEDALRDIGSTPQVFIDDAIIERVKGLEAKVHRPKKAGLIREADGSPWARGDQHAVVRDTAGRFHMTYRFLWQDPAVSALHPSIGQDKAHWFRETVAYATSKDGIAWEKPRLGLVEGPSGFRPAPKEKWADGVFQEPVGTSRDNNLGCPIAMIQDLGGAEAKRRYLVNVLRRADTHPFAETADAGLYFAADVPDLINDRDWRRKMEVIWEGKRRGARGPMVRVAGYDERDKVWVECAQCSFGNIVRLGGRSISRWTSKDLKEWSAEELVLPIAKDESRDPKAWVEYMDIRVTKLHDFWLGQLIVFHGDRTSPQYAMPGQPNVWRKGTTEMRLIVSRDAGRTWARVGGATAWLPHHDAEDGFDYLVFTGSPVRVGDELWLYYGCWDGEHLVWTRDGKPYYANRTRIGRTARAVLRWDGYRSYSGEGELVTKPFTAAGRGLRVNASGGVRVELQDAAGKPLPGFALADCERLGGDGVSQAVRWRGQSELPPLKTARLRFEVVRGDLYGFQII